MSRCDKAIALLSGDGGGVIKPIASRDEKWRREREREKNSDMKVESSGLVYQRDDWIGT